MAKAAGANTKAHPLCIADVSDNPGAAGRGNTPDLLKDLLDANVDRALLWLFVDSAEAEIYYTAGAGGEISPTLHIGSTRADATEYVVEAKVLALSDGFFAGEGASWPDIRLILVKRLRSKSGG